MDDIDMEAAQESDEMSDTADLGTNSVEPRENKMVELKPFNFLDHPHDVRQQILRRMLVSDEPIKPFWNLGALEVAAEVSSKENFTTVLVAFAGNKELLDEATTILYGENSFKLQHAKVSLWWLKRIGSNISKIKTLTILPEEGVMDRFRTRFETLWYEIIHVLKVQHRLQYLQISFVNWTNRVDDRDGLDPAKIVYILEPRYALIRTLLSFRGLGKAVIKPGEFVNKYCAGLLEVALVLDPGQTTREVIAMEKDVAEPKKAKYLFT